MTEMSRYSHTQTMSVRQSASGSTVTYHGQGYTYHMHKSVKDITVKLQIARKKLKEFVSWCWANRRKMLPGLCICEQGTGWFDVFVLNDNQLINVLNFVRNLNQWALGAFNPRPSDNRHHYFVVARRFEHTKPKQPTQPTHRPYFERTDLMRYDTPQPIQVRPAVSTDRLDSLVRTVNSRYGH